MKLCSMPQNLRECVALGCGMVPTPEVTFEAKLFGCDLVFSSPLAGL